MKIRILGNSIRLRLSRTDMDRLEKDGEVTEDVLFSKSAFRYGIRVEPGPISAAFSEGNMIITIPGEQAEPWIRTDQVGIEHTIDQDDAPPMKVLLEKDFACMIPRPGEEDLYPNPEQEK